MSRCDRPAGRLSLSLRNERGSVVIMTAGFMLLAVLCLALVVDTGRLYMEKRSLQRLADTVALSVASQNACETSEGAAATLANTVLHTDNEAPAAVVVASVLCGASSGNPRVFTDNAATSAVQVVLSHPVARSLVAGGLFSAEPVALRATAVAGRSGNPLAGLTIRTSVATVSSSQSTLLNTLLGTMLGGSLNITAVGYEGLLNTQVNLLNYLDALGVGLGLGVGSYDQVLNTNLTISQLASLSATALSQSGVSGSSGSTLSAAATALGLLSAGAAADSTTITLGQLLNLQTGTEAAAADLSLGLFDILQGGIQLANGSSVVSANLPVNLFGLASATIKVKAIEPAQLSAIGDPSEIDLVGHDPDESPNIYVRTAQVRTLLTLSMTGLGSVTNSLLTALSGALSPLTNFLAGNFSVLHLVSDLLSAVITACGSYDTCAKNVVYSDVAGQLQIGLDVGGAEAYVTGHSCDADSKTLDTRASTEAGHIYVGTLNEGNFFSSTSSISVSPATLVELGYRKTGYQSCFFVLGIGSCSGVQKWYTSGGTWSTIKSDARKYVIAALTTQADMPLASSTMNPGYTDPPDVGQAPAYQDMSSTDIVASLKNTLAGMQIKAYSSTGGVLGGLLTTSFSLLNGLVSTIGNLLVTLGDAVLDPLLNSLLDLLGANLAATELGANLTCNADPGVKLLN